MTNGSVTLEKIHQGLSDLFREVREIKHGIEDLRDVDLTVRPEYLRKLKGIEQGTFLSREELDKEIEE